MQDAGSISIPTCIAGKLSKQEKSFDSSQHPTIFLLLCFWQAITLFSELQLNVWLGRDYFWTAKLAFLIFSFTVFPNTPTAGNNANEYSQTQLPAETKKDPWPSCMEDRKATPQMRYWRKLMGKEMSPLAPVAGRKQTVPWALQRQPRQANPRMSLSFRTFLSSSVPLQCKVRGGCSS